MGLSNLWIKITVHVGLGVGRKERTMDSEVHTFRSPTPLPVLRGRNFQPTTTTTVIVITVTVSLTAVWRGPDAIRNPGIIDTCITFRVTSVVLTRGSMTRGPGPMHSRGRSTVPMHFWGHRRRIKGPTILIRVRVPTRPSRRRIPPTVLGRPHDPDTTCRLGPTSPVVTRLSVWVRVCVRRRSPSNRPVPSVLSGSGRMTPDTPLDSISVPRVDDPFTSNRLPH